MSKQPNILDAINATIEFVYENECSWYRDHWQKHGLSKKPRLKTLDDLALIPPVSKADFIASAHPLEYTFVPPSQVTTFRTTSGTTSGELFMFPRTHLYPDIRDTLKRDGVTAFLYMGGFHKNPATILDYGYHGLQVIAGDIHMPEETVRTVVEHGIDTFLLTPSVLELLLPHILEHNYAPQIKKIILYGELTNASTLKRITANYPNAAIYTEYSLSESGQAIGYTTPRCNLEPNQFRSYPSAYPEIVSDELLITTTTNPHPLPLIRYRTGDSAHLIEHADASLGDTPIFELTGRKNVDWVRVGGLELRYTSAENALRQLPLTISLAQFSIVVSHTPTEPIHIKVSGTLSPDTTADPEIVSELISQTLQDHWQVTASKKLAHFIESGHCARPQVDLLTTPDKASLKKTGIRLLN